MKSSIQTYCTKENLAGIRQFITKSLARTALSDIQKNALVLAVDEVCANVIIHSADCDCKKTLEVFTDVKKHKAIFEVIDKGHGYDLRNHKMPHLKEIIKTKRKGGVGLLLVQKIMDKIDFIPDTKGNIIRLTKHF
ncbi:hypothetical protein MNBD_BACTEROID06-116 [hydrothermal vent metagenome]|uniref:Histidine kinase/HSP90-like ATPase domain-containing protein n=1 Tax=hydrothermal vent metagenome TaxID=652676 RepID=A0A3B0UC39_9ZZZZ